MEFLEKFISNQKGIKDIIHNINTKTNEETFQIIFDTYVQRKRVFLVEQVELLLRYHDYKLVNILGESEGVVDYYTIQIDKGFTNLKQNKVNLVIKKGDIVELKISYKFKYKY